MLVAQVVLDIATRALDVPYTYSVPENLEDVSVGCAVLVPFGGREAVGFVVGLIEEDAEECGIADSTFSVKPIKQVLSKPYFDEEGAACASFLAEEYVAPLSVCVRLFTPPSGVPKVVRGADGRWHIEQPQIGAVDDRWIVPGSELNSFKPRKNAVKQIAVLNAVRNGDVRMSELAMEFGNVSQVINRLEEAGAIRIEHRRRMRGYDDSVSNGATAKKLKLDELTEGQAKALAKISNALSEPYGNVVLVDGVTGSGKTEVYMRAIEQVLESGRNAIVLVPEISLTPQTVARFRGRFGDSVAVMHSKMSQGERYDQWDLIREGGARVVVGARSALFTPMQNVGIIVIDEEHESTYKQESAPRYVSRDVARWMVKRSGATLVLGSATPSIESLYLAKHDPGWSYVRLSERANRRPLPEIEIVDMAKEFSSGARSMFSRRLVDALKQELLAGHKAVLLLNQRGFARFLLCRDCGFVPECIHCATSLTYHERGNKLVCHHCGYTVASPAVCPSCGSPYMKKFGAGTQRVEAELRSMLDSEIGLLPASIADSISKNANFGKMEQDAGEIGGMPVPIIRMDADTTSKKGAHQELLERFASAPSAVLLGTQMIAKGLDFDDVTLVGVINADTQLHLPDYRAAERTFDLIQQVAGRAGRAGLPGKVLVQTYEADSVAIRAAASYNRQMFLDSELPKRDVLKFPPYVRLANALVWGKNEKLVKDEAESLHKAISKAVSEYGGSDWQMLPATPCAIEKKRDNFRWHIVVKAPPDSGLPEVLGPVFRSRTPDKLVNIALDVDPADLL